MPILEEKEISSTSFEKYTGKYQIKDGFVLEVYYHDGKMYGSVMGDAKEIKAYDTDKFYTLNTDIRLEFERESDASISGVNLLLPMPMKGLKIQ